MGQRPQQQNRGGGNNQTQQYTPNEQISFEQRIGRVMATLEDRRAELSYVLPADVSIDAFLATINQALRAAPDLLTCTPKSVINACVKAAYDGLRVDGKEAAIVWDMITVAGKKEKTARYMPMYQGLVQQVLRGGLVLSCEADVIYANDKFAIIRGSNPQIVHEPLIVGDRGDPVAVYNVARLANGAVTTSYLLAADVLDIASMSQSGWDKEGKTVKGVWKRWPREQWKKTILRQHRKTLPVGTGTVIRDMEAREEFPQFDRQTPHPQLAQAPARPTRQAIAQQEGTYGRDMDFGGFGQQEGEVVENERGDEQQQANPAEQQQETVSMPADPAEWDAWRKDVEGRLKAGTSVDAVNAIVRDELARINASPFADDIMGLTTDRIADLIAGE